MAGIFAKIFGTMFCFVQWRNIHFLSLLFIKWYFETDYSTNFSFSAPKDEKTNIKIS